ncbi:hypothetical protein [Mycolicibacter arupensis]|jgi:hypothetical protein|uniref:Scaffolding protein n=1 Tax=Mycolicibacter arupensis TaxID=342002 RepID=A0A5C7YDE2_9MYCO|nr:hypothetical protein [Mycolicibacter arupensis]TXI59959.1 MAG: hypothetical protein E6Q54_01430 [Mycolicibacter arupensis]
MTTNTPTTQTLAAPDAPAEPDPAQVPAEGSEAEGDPENGPDDPADDDGTTDPALKKARQEAAATRVKLREAEARADAAEQAIVNHALEQAGLDQRLWQAGGVELDSLRDEQGALTVAAVYEAAGKIRQEFGLGRPGVPQPNSQQGNPPGGRPKPESGFADAFRS